MIVKNNKIVEATECELFNIYLKQGWDDIYSFSEYLYRIKQAGTKIIKKVLMKINKG